MMSRPLYPSNLLAFIISNPLIRPGSSTRWHKLDRIPYHPLIVSKQTSHALGERQFFSLYRDHLALA